MNIKDNGSNKWIVFATWALVAVTGAGIVIVRFSYDKLLKHYEKATELDWRPFLNIELGDSVGDSLPVGGYELYYRQGETIEADTVFKQMSEISYEGGEYLAVRNIGFRFPQKINYRNSGSTPLRITGEIVSALTEEEWVETYSKNAEIFVGDLKTFPELKEWETDVVILAGESYPSRHAKGLPRRMRKGLFEKYIKRDSSIIFYPYLYTQYKDPFDNEYNVLFMMHTVIKFESIEKCWIPRVPSIGKVERYRWDVK